MRGFTGICDEFEDRDGYARKCSVVIVPFRKSASKDKGKGQKSAIAAPSPPVDRVDEFFSYACNKGRFCYCATCRYAEGRGK